MTDLRSQKQEALRKALDSLARYKYMMFGYWAAVWVHLNHMDGNREPSPFRQLVLAAREMRDAH